MYKKLFLLASIMCLPFSANGYPFRFVPNWENGAKLAGALACFGTTISAAKAMYADSNDPEVSPSLEAENKDPFRPMQVVAPVLAATSSVLGFYLIAQAAKNSPINVANAALQLAKVAGGSLLSNGGRIAYNAHDQDVLPKATLVGTSLLLVLGGLYLQCHGINNLIK